MQLFRTLVFALLVKIADQFPAFDLSLPLGPGIIQVDPRIAGCAWDGLGAVGLDVPIDGQWAEGDPAQLAEITQGSTWGSGSPIPVGILENGPHNEEAFPLIRSRQ